jgi:hypothetical protein
LRATAFVVVVVCDDGGRGGRRTIRAVPAIMSVKEPCSKQVLQLLALSTCHYNLCVGLWFDVRSPRTTCHALQVQGTCQSAVAHKHRHFWHCALNWLLLQAERFPPGDLSEIPDPLALSRFGEAHRRKNTAVGNTLPIIYRGRARRAMIRCFFQRAICRLCSGFHHHVYF